MACVLRPALFALTVLCATASEAGAQQASPPAQSPTPSTPAAVAKPPLPNRANNSLPSWLRIRGEFRERAEGFRNAGFTGGRDDLYYLSRFRFNAAVSMRYLRGTLQLQDARVGRKTIGATGTPFAAAFDLRQGYVDVGSAKSLVIVRLGRQELAYGDQRLVGHLNWTNAGRTFDAARVTISSPGATVDVFAGSIVRILDGEFDKSGNGNRFAGAYVSTGKLIRAGTVEPYLFYRRDIGQRAELGALGALAETTTGVRLTGRLPAALDYNIEMDLQRGSMAIDQIRAWAGHWQIRKTLGGARATHIIGEYNYASGDENPADGVRQTFDQLYPTGHDKYGLADQVGWRNIHDLRAGFDISPWKATPISVSYHSYWLAERRDGLYGASGALLVRLPAGAPSRRVGQELDLQVSRSITPQIALAAGYAHLFAGPFLQAATPGKSYTGPYVMATYVFLAEK